MKKRKILSLVVATLITLSFSEGTTFATIKSVSMTYPSQFTKSNIVVESDEVMGKKIEALIKTMTQDEKLNLLMGGSNPDNVGYVGNASYMVGVPRLGVPEVRMYDGPTGINCAKETTGLPLPQLLASTWSQKMANTYGEIMGEENVSVAGNFQLGPQLDITRSPFFRRSKDQLGEDPFLLSKLGVEMTKGIQSEGAVATLKHFAGYSQDTGSANVIIDEQTLNEVQFPQFEAAIKEGNAGSIMNSYTKLNGSYASSNGKLNKEILRDQLGFTGLLMSDWIGNHEFSLNQGLDVEMPGLAMIKIPRFNTPDDIKAALKAGKVTQADIDLAVKHVLNSLGKVGYLALVQLDGDTGYVKAEEGRTEPIKLVNTYVEDVANGMLNRNAESIKEIAEKGAVLLKNDNSTLPIKSSDYTGASSVAMIGVGANNLIAGIGGERSYGTLSRMKSPYEEMVKMSGSNANIVNEVGVDIIGTAIPEGNFYQDAAGTTQGLVRSYGMVAGDAAPPFFAPAEDVAMEGHSIGEAAGITNGSINYTTGTIDGKVNQTYKNSADGTAFTKGDCYTWKGYLKAPESGTYHLILESIGGESLFKINLDTTASTYTTIGKTNTRDGAHWPWSSIVPTKEGMDITASDVTLEAGKLYPVTITGHSTLSDKDLQLRAAWITPSQKTANYNNAVQAAKVNDKIIFFAWDVAGAQTAATDGKPATVSSLDLDSDQLALLKDVIKVAKENGHKVSVVLNNGTPVTMGDWIDGVDSMLEMWMPGQEGGIATAELLLGKVNPSGKTAQTFPKYTNETPVTDTAAHTAERLTGILKAGDTDPTITFSEGIFFGYRWYDKENVTPLFDFGTGLSYTTFKYSNPNIKKIANVSHGYNVTFTVTNTGSVTGDEVAQVYLGKTEVPAGVQMAEKQLAGFVRIENLAPGASKTVTVKIDERSLSYWNPNIELQQRADGTKDKWVIADPTENGGRAIYIGSSESDIRLSSNTVQ